MFMAPSSGVYGFHLSIMVTDGNIIYFNNVKNGSAVGTMCVEGRGYGLTTVTEFWTVELNAYDEVWIWADTLQLYMDGATLSFQAFL